MNCYIYLDRDDLVQHNACGEGLALFDAIATLRGRRRKIRLEWSALSFLWLESDGRRFASWLYQRGLVPMPSFVGADFHGANLGGAYLRGANLGGANLGGADFHGANLGGANLHGADLGGADFHGANLGGAYLGGADFHGANLGGAYLTGANLTGANLTDAYLTGAYLTGAYLTGVYRPYDPPAGWVPDASGYLRRVTA